MFNVSLNQFDSSFQLMKRPRVELLREKIIQFKILYTYLKPEEKEENIGTRLMFHHVDKQ